MNTPADKWFQDKGKFIELGGSKYEEKILCLITAILGRKNGFISKKG